MSALIVGASVAGVAVAQGLRKQGYSGSITVVGAEDHLPYDKPPLSKHALKPDWEEGRGLLHPESFYQDNDIALCLGRAAVELDPQGPSVRLTDGTVLKADDVVIATGGRARKFPGGHPEGVYTIRQCADSAQIRSRLAPGVRLVVLGAGFIGAEAAAMATERGAEVTIVDQQPLPFADRFGTAIAGALADRHTRHGVRTRWGTAVQGVARTEQRLSVTLADGEELDADLVIVGFGIEPETAWLTGSGVELGNGVICDRRGRTSVPHVWAVGDVAAWQQADGSHRRVEHWTSAKEQGLVVAQNIVGRESTHDAVPYFWSDQYGARLQSLGTLTGFDTVKVIHGDLASEEFAVAYGRDGRLIGALGLAAAKHVMPLRGAIAEGRALDEDRSGGLKETA